MPIDDARAFWITAPGRGEIRDETLPAAGPDDVIVRTLYSGISRGTESLVFAGRVPASERGRMRAPHQAGDFPGPVKYGYSSVGRVEAGPPALVGRTVFCLFPHQTRYVVAAGDVVALPDGVPPGRAVLAANMETALNAVWDASPPVGTRLSVVGAGTVGCLAGWLAARHAGCDVELVDTDPGKVAVAAALGLAFATPARARGDADVVMHASGAPAGLVTALELAGFEATILELSWFGDTRVTLPLGAAFHSRRLSLRASQVGSVALPVRGRIGHADRLARALGLLAADDALDTLVTGDCAFETLPTELERLTRVPNGVLCRRVVYA